jgi:integrase
VLQAFPQFAMVIPGHWLATTASQFLIPPVLPLERQGMTNPPKRSAIRLTARAVQALKPGATRFEVPDLMVRGLHLTVFPSGVKTWCCRYWDKVRRKRAKLVLGRYPDISLSDARSLASDVRAAIAKRIDPKTLRPTKVAEPQQGGISVEVAWRRYEAAQRVVLGLRESTIREKNRLFHVDVLPHWRNRTLASITPDDVVELTSRVVERGAIIQSNRLLATLKAFLAWTSSQRILRSRSPAADIKKPAKQYPRDRWLDANEIRRLIFAADQIGDPLASAVRLLLCFGSRRNEISAAPWREFDLQAKVWRLPAERSKNRQPLELPLPPFALAILDKLPPPRRDSDLVIGIPNGSWHRMKAKVDELLPDLAPWCWHDLRRSTASHMGMIGIDLHLIEKILNHRTSAVISSVGAVYQRNQFKREIADALAAWGARLAQIIAGEAESNVVPMRR